MARTRSAAIRESLDHPIVDADGHYLELNPLFTERVTELVQEIGGAAMRQRFVDAFFQPYGWQGKVDDPWEARLAARPFWGWPTRNTLDRATAHLPRLLYERLDEIGIDFTILLPSIGLAYTDMLDGELCQVVNRAVNVVYAQDFGGYPDRMTPAGIIPMHTPGVAIEELEYAVGELGMKAILIPGYVPRPIPKIHREYPQLLPYVTYLDTYGLDSEHDYDPFWRRCVELGVAPLSHSGLIFARPTRSVTSFMYNHISCLAQAHESLAKSLFFGGVTRRFPSLNIGFLEGGVGWACTLYADMVGHWEKRNGAVIGNLDPAALDVDLMLDLVERYGTEDVRARAGDLRAAFSARPPAPDHLDEWWRCEISRGEEIRELFADRFYFGCEPDDPVTAWAFAENVNPFGARLRAMFGSDISHWDCPDMTTPVEEAYEQAERGRITEDDFSDFTFGNVVRLHGGMNPRFFEGTVVEKAAAALLDEEREARAPSPR